MFDIRKRKAFQTVGELRALLNRLPAYADVYICGDANCFFHEQADRSSSCLVCDDLREQYEEELEKILADETPEERDRYLESLWLESEDVPLNPNTECIEDPYLCFSVGTHREDIWHWFDTHHSKGVAYLLNEFSRSSYPQESTLSQFIREEVPCRLSEVFELSDEQMTPELVQACVKALDSNTDTLFDYEKIDNKLREILSLHGIDGRDEM